MHHTVVGFDSGLRGEAAVRFDEAMERAADLIEPSRLGARDRQRRERIATIRAAAYLLFHEHGFANVTVEDISERAGMSARTFFNYFSTKEECVVLPHRQFSEPLRILLSARPLDEPSLAATSEAFCGLFAILEANPLFRSQLLAGALLQQREPALRAADSTFRKIWEDEVASGLLLRGETPIAAYVYSAAGVGTWKAAMFDWANRGGSDPVPGAIRRGFAILSDGLRELVH
jgi:AcrR family transcriptional regulator